MVALADEVSGGRLVITGGGGYDPYRTVPRAWSHAWAALIGAELPGPLPEAWLETWRARLGSLANNLPTEAGELPEEFPPLPRRAAISRRNRVVANRTIETLQELWRKQEPNGGA
ncbi:MAG: hypothetical protein WDA03_10125, partial [Trueperaceae bacterium]